MHTILFFNAEYKILNHTIVNCLVSTSNALHGFNESSIIHLFKLALLFNSPFRNESNGICHDDAFFLGNHTNGTVVIGHCKVNTDIHISVLPINVVHSALLNIVDVNEGFSSGTGIYDIAMLGQKILSCTLNGNGSCPFLQQIFPYFRDFQCHRIGMLQDLVIGCPILWIVRFI